MHGVRTSSRGLSYEASSRSFPRSPSAGASTLTARTLSVLALVSTSLWPAPATAQETPGQPEAAATLEAALTLTRIRGESAVFAGGAGLLDIRGRLSAGGGGWVMLTGVTIPGGATGGDFDLLVAYGGLVVQTRLHEMDGTRVHLRALLGAGAAKVRIPVVDTEIGADNFGVVEPEMVVIHRLTGPLSLGAGLGYRIPFGVQDLPGVRRSDLGGLAGRLTVTATTF